MRFATRRWIVIIGLLGTLQVQAREFTLQFGMDDNWRQFTHQGVKLQPGWRGHYDIVLDNTAPTSTEGDLHLSFDTTPFIDAASNYLVKPQHVSQLATPVRRGSGAAYFDGTSTLRLHPGQSSLFGQRGTWADFSIELYSYATQVREYSTLFKWQASPQRQGTHGAATHSDHSTYSEAMQLQIIDGRMQWKFMHFFALEDKTLPVVTLHAATKTYPRTWQHHLLRYNHSRGLLEYYLDGIIAAVAYVTQDGSEGSARYSHTHTPTDYQFELGSTFSGILDEVKITPHYLAPRPPSLYAESGLITSEIIDLSQQSGRLLAIEGITETPENSQIRIEYRAALNRADLVNDTLPWLEVGTTIATQPVRFVQLRAYLLPDGVGATPRLSSIVVRVDRPPRILAPSNVQILKNNLSPEIRWQPPVDTRTIGYRLYYGPRPGYYPHMVDVGRTTRYTPLLDADSPYYFVLESYDVEYPNVAGGRSSPVYVRTYW